MDGYTLVVGSSSQSKRYKVHQNLQKPKFKLENKQKYSLFVIMQSFSLLLIFYSEAELTGLNLFPTTGVLSNALKMHRLRRKMMTTPVTPLLPWQHTVSHCVHAVYL